MFRWVQKAFFVSANRKIRRSERRRVRPRLEALEDRITPVTWMVTLATDNDVQGGGTAGTKAGTGDLRYCCRKADPGDSIAFDIGSQTINLNAQITLSLGGVTIDGGNQVTISGQNKTRIFEIGSALQPDTFKNLTFTQGNGSGGNGGAILVDSGGGLNITALVST